MGFKVLNTAIFTLQWANYITSFRENSGCWHSLLSHGNDYGTDITYARCLY